MPVIHVTYTIGEVTKTQNFSSNKKGHQQSVKFIKGLHDDRKEHPWYYKLKSIEILEDIFKEIQHKRTKKRNEIESRLLAEKQERENHLAICDVTEPPPPIKIEITHS
jgi:hypothetical protein